MFTRNYYSLLALQRMVGSRAYEPIMLTTTAGMLMTSYNSSWTNTSTSWIDTVLVTSTAKTIGIYFGDGTTPPSISDYNCSGEEITGLSIVSTDSTVTYANNKYRCRIAFILKNTSDKEVTISEVCRKGLIPTGNGSNTQPVMFERSVLDTPVVIPAGQNGTVEYITTVQIPD